MAPTDSGSSAPMPESRNKWRRTNSPKSTTRHSRQTGAGSPSACPRGAGSGIDSNPAWSPDGKYLYFPSSRHENPVGSDIEFDFAILKSTGIYAIPLARDTASPVAPKSDEGSGASYDGPSAQ